MLTKSFNYIFVDESGDPGKPFEIDASGEKVPTGASKYYILTALCLNSLVLFALEDRVLETKNRFGFGGEIKSNEISLALHKALLNILNDLEVKTYYRLIDKTAYKGVFAVNGSKKLHNIFDEYNLAKLVAFAISKEGTTDTEIIIDRTDRRLLDGKFDNFNDYLAGKVNTKTLKRIGYITHVNSEYVNAMQISDLVSGALKDYVTGKNKDLKKVMQKKFLIKIW